MTQGKGSAQKILEVLAERSQKTKAERQPSFTHSLSVESL